MCACCARSRRSPPGHRFEEETMMIAVTPPAIKLSLIRRNMKRAELLIRISFLRMQLWLLVKLDRLLLWIWPNKITDRK